MHRAALAILLTLSLASRADTLLGTVTGIADGDTLYVTDHDHHEYKIRLLGIDAPEHDQAFGEESRQALKSMAYRRAVSIDWQHYDQYGRLLGKIVLDDGRDVNLAQLESGLAWWNRKYAYEQTDEDAIRYREAAFVARKKRLGLWAEKNPVPPWRWRYANRIETDRLSP